MGQCRDCKHWSGQRIDARTCCVLTESSSGHPNHPTSKAVALDGEPWTAGLFTAPDFGCVQWEAK